MLKRSLVAQSAFAMHLMRSKCALGKVPKMTDADRVARTMDYTKIGATRRSVMQFSRYLKKNGKDYSDASVTSFSKLSPEEKANYDKVYKRAFNKSQAVRHSPMWYAARELGWREKIPANTPVRAIGAVYREAFSRLSAAEQAKYTEMAKTPASWKRTAGSHLVKYNNFVKAVGKKATPEQIAEHGNVVRLAAKLWNQQKKAAQK